MSGVKILVVCHKNTALLKSKILLPIQVGTALQRKAGEYACGRYRRKYIRKKSDVL